METKWQEGNGEHYGFLYFPQHDANNNNTVNEPFKVSLAVKVEEKEVAFAHGVK